MSAAEIMEQLKSLPESERTNVARGLLQILYPGSNKIVERLIRRLEHPDVPEDFWEGVEEIEDGKALEMHDEDFERPPV